MFKETRIMLQTKLLLLEYVTINDEDKNHWKLAAIRSIRELLLRLDSNAEVVPVTNASKLQSLLSSLKGEELSKEEEMLVREIITV